MEEYEQLSLWGEMFPFYEIKEPVVLCEFFAGIGSQRKGIELCGIKIDDEKSRTVEWAVPSIIAYNSIHFKDKTNYGKDLTKEELVDKVKGISTDYNQPLTMDQLNKKPVEWLRNVYNHITAIKDLINVMNVKGSDLGTWNDKEQTSIWTYSFPCQDISLAGLGKSLEKGSGTRSGLLWEIERLLLEREREKLPLPSVLIMENVDALVNQKHMPYFKLWQEELDKLGYSSYVQVLNAKDYGIPQNRKRVFMVSILGDYAYDFPRKIKLKYRLRDLLESEVDEKYYLDNETVQRISKWNAQQKPIDNAIDPLKDEDKVSPTLTARGAGEEHSGMVLIKETNDKVLENNDGIVIKNNTEKGYLVANDGDGINIGTRMHMQRGNVQKDTCQTLTCKGGEDVGVVVDDEKT